MITPLWVTRLPRKPLTQNHESTPTPVPETTEERAISADNEGKEKAKTQKTPKYTPNQAKTTTQSKQTPIERFIHNTGNTTTPKSRSRSVIGSPPTPTEIMSNASRKKRKGHT